MAFTRKNEEAVSPVIGVILMVAITVILAAVIAAFVFGMAGNIQKTKVVAATMSRPNSSYVIITYQGGQDAASLQGLGFTVNGANATAQSSSAGVSPTSATTTGIFATGTSMPIGASFTLTAGSHSNVEVIGMFSDGSSQVIVQNTI
ncbi:MAG: type IV pilin N-terminal domain-containing protein [Methanoregula sp.]|uniref:type IV pilin n=1 Tax=Methanoregula sp. TaxID=2052170 RepID=UPI003C75BF7E